MKYTLQINQFLLGKYEQELREAKIDYNDLMIVSLLLDRVESGGLNTKEIFGHTYYQMNRTFVTGNLPFLKMASYNAYRYRLDKLEKAGLIRLSKAKKKGGKTWVKPTKKICLEEWFYSKYSKTQTTKKFSLLTTKKFSHIKSIKNKEGKRGQKAPVSHGKNNPDWLEQFKQNIGA